MQVQPSAPGATPDPGALAMWTAAGVGQANTLATAQLINGLSGLLVGESLSRLVRETLGWKAPGPPESGIIKDEKTPATAGVPLDDLLLQSVLGRVIALSNVNTYLNLATMEQVRRMGAQVMAPPEPPAIPWLQAPYGYGHPSLPMPYPFRSPGRSPGR